MKNSDIKDGLDGCERELDTAMNLFQVYFYFYPKLTTCSITARSSMPLSSWFGRICLDYHHSSNIALQSGQRDVINTMRSNTVELRDLLIQALTVQSEIQQIIEMQNAGAHVAERFMQAGQQVSYQQNYIFQLRDLIDCIYKELLRLRQSQFKNDIDATSSSLLPQPHDSSRYLQCQRGLINLHHETGIPPTIKILDGEVTKVCQLAVGGGTYSDIWVGMWLGEEKVVELGDY